MTPEQFRRLALAMPAATEGAHMNHPDFRVAGKIFATLWPKDKRGVVLLLPEQQELLVNAEPKVFAAWPGGWGVKGATTISLAAADKKTVQSALAMAWRNIAPKRLTLS